MIKKLYRKLRQKIFKRQNPVGNKHNIPKDKFDISIFKNMQWIGYGSNYYPYHILVNNGQTYYIPHIATKRNSNGDTVMNEFLITKN
jgi:hypothetical protein